MADTPRLYFRQILAGMDIAEDDPVAQQMVNFVYLIGDRETGEAVVIDPAYDPQAMLDILEADGMRLTGALATHYHADHVGGSLGGMAQITGIAELLELVQVPIHVQATEAEWINKGTGVPIDHLASHSSGDTVMVGEIPITLIHTPGHTPGSQCFLVDGKKLVSGDTLFLNGCGRTDLPGSDPEEMYRSLTQRLAQVPDDAVLYPGHLYSEKPSASMAETRQRNVVFRPDSLEQWMMMFS
ncbi:MBL fold metallo-hydrolase [Aquihabitans sp. McL0605]|uniref:MBL fold metallo-hydrolase n=1 Tax=Aquihabitans sp. McL0605 TaxID=3415671 RepID=UPI003CF32B82